MRRKTMVKEEVIMDKEFIVEVYELHAQKYRVKADSPEEAQEAVNRGEGECVDDGLEYIEVAECYKGSGMLSGIRSVREVKD